MMSTLLLVFLLLDAPPSPSPSPSPSASPSPSPAPAVSAKRETLAEVAARRPPASKKSPPAKVLTNDDLEKARAGGAPVSVLSVDGVEPPEGDRPVIGEGVVTEVLQDEGTWRQRAEAARAVIKDATALVQQNEQRLAELRDDVNPEDPMNPFRQQTREAEIIAATERLETARAEAAAARQAFTDLEDEARRASVPPGWLREP